MRFDLFQTLRRVLMLLGVLLLAISAPIPATPHLPSPPAQTSAISDVLVTTRQTMAIIAWQGSSSVNYKVEVSVDAQFAQAETKLVPNATQTVLSDLEPGIEYYLRITSDNASSPVVTFTTEKLPPPLAPPVLKLSSPSFDQINATWEHGAKDVHYRVQLSDNADFKKPEKRNLQTSKTTFKNLLPNTEYYVRVQATEENGEPLSDWSDMQQIKTSREVPLRVATYNILCFTKGCVKGKASWNARRDAVAKTILKQAPDVMGIQEASERNVPGAGVSQYKDLLNRLDGKYKLTDPNKGASRGTRIIYNPETLNMDSHGTIKLPKSTSVRYLTWAFFTQQDTGKKFIFANTHLEHHDDKKGSAKYWGMRKRQAEAIVRQLKQLNRDNLPVIVVGDFNSNKYDSPSNIPYDLLQQAGYKDPLGNAYRTTHTAPGEFVEKRINTGYGSYNSYRRTPRKGSSINGANIDYILVTPMRVAEYETVLNLDDNGKFIGTIPSDHNMLRADVYLP